MANFNNDLLAKLRSSRVTSKNAGGFNNELLTKIRNSRQASSNTGGFNDELLSKLRGGSSQNKNIKKAVGEPQGVFFKTLDYLSRPLYATAGAANAVLKDENVLKEAKKGFLGQERETFSDVLGSAGWKPTSTKGKVARGVAGFALDVLLDPLTYVGVGVLTKAGRTAKMAGKINAGATLAEQASRGQRALLSIGGQALTPKVVNEAALGAIGKAGSYVREGNRLTSPVVQTVGKALSSKFRPKGVTAEEMATLIDARNTARALKDVGEQEALNVATAIQKNIDEIFSGKKVDKNKLNDLLHKVESKSMEVPKELQPLHKKLINHADNVSKRRKDIGKNVFDEAEDYNYWIHQLSDEAKEKLAKTTFDLGQSGLFKSKTKSDLTRKFVGFGEDVIDLKSGKVYKSGQVINTLSKSQLKSIPPTNIKQVSISAINDAIGYEMFKSDLPTTAYEMGKRVASSESGVQFMNRVRTLGVTANKAPAGYMKIPVGDLKGLRFKPELGEAIGRVVKTYTDKGDVGKFMKSYDKVQNFWKGSATVVNPAFHFRNAISNVFQNYIGDVRNPAVYGKAALAQSGAKGGKVVSAGGVKDVYKSFVERGLGGTGWLGSDIEKSIKMEVSQGKIAKLIKSPRFIGTVIEDNAKLAHYIDKLEKGFPPKQAAESVKKYLFDYRDLTDFERKVVKRIFPFYSWTRNNLPLQVETLVTNPGKVSTIAKGIQETEKGTSGEVDYKTLPKWLVDAIPVKLWGNSKETKFFRLESYLPTADLQNLEPSEMAKTVMSMLTPIVKAPIEQIANYNFYFEEPLQRYSGEKEEFWRAQLPVRVVSLIKQFRPASEVNKLVQKKYNPQKRRMESPTIADFTHRLQNWTTGGKVITRYKDKDRAASEREAKSLISKIKSEMLFQKRSGDLEEVQRLASLLKDAEKKRFI